MLRLFFKHLHQGFCAHKQNEITWSTGGSEPHE
jgi:hypothetical protein